MSRSDIRSAILDAKPKKKVVNLFGEKVEVRQPNMKAVLAVTGNDDPLERFIMMMTNYCYVPGTNEKVFEDTDKSVLEGVPFGSEFDELGEAIKELTGITDVDVKEQEGNSSGTPSTTQ